MIMKQFLAYGIIGSIAIAFITATIELISEDNWYFLVGIGFMVFGIWGSVLLLSNKKQSCQKKKKKLRSKKT